MLLAAQIAKLFERGLCVAQFTTVSALCDDIQPPSLGTFVKFNKSPEPCQQSSTKASHGFGCGQVTGTA